MIRSALSDTVEDHLERLTSAVTACNARIAVAESLTGGQLAAALSAAEGAGDWFRGSVVAYHPEVKYAVLKTPRGPVVTRDTAVAMATSVAQLLGADYTVALTGVGGPDPKEGHPAGTVHLATYAAAGGVEARLFQFPGDPVQVMEQSIAAAISALTDRVLRSQ